MKKTLTVEMILVCIIVIGLIFNVKYYFSRGNIANKADCKLDNVHVGQLIQYDGKPYVITENEDLSSIGVYWIRLNEVSRFSR